MMFAENHVLKGLQLAFSLAGTYSGKIDGIWGGGSENAALSFFNFVKSSSDPITPMVANSSYSELVSAFQTNAKTLGFYANEIDGVWGKGSKNALEGMTRGARIAQGYPELKCAWSKLVGDEFIEVIQNWVSATGREPEVVDYLMTVMAFESGRTFSPSVQNAGGSQAFGLLQFMAPAATDLGFTLEEIRNMSQLEQLQQCVLPYFDMREKRKPMTKLEDFYLAVLYPALVGKRLDEVLFKEGTVGYRQNKGLDRNGDGTILTGEIAETIYNVYYEGMKPSNRRTC